MIITTKVNSVTDNIKQVLLLITIMILTIIIIYYEKWWHFKTIRVAIYAVFLIAHSVKKMILISVCIRVEVL